MKRILFIIVLLVFCLLAEEASAQSYNMSNLPISTCSGTFYDDGGLGGNYNDLLDYTQTFTSSSGNRLQFIFTSFTAFGSSDSLMIYDGPTTSYPLIGIYIGTNSPGTVTSTGIELTFVWITNNNSSPAAGWVANISCTTPALTPYAMNTGTITACSGIFYDNGGGGANYPDNENRVQTFCSGTTDFLQFTFNNSFTNFDLSVNDSLFIFDGPNTSSPPLALLTKNSYAETVTSSGTCITFKFVSGGTGNSIGWAATFNCTSTVPSGASYKMSSGIRYTCGGSFFDDGGPTDNYNDNIDRTQTFVSYNGNRIQFSFTSFDTFNNNDSLLIYDGPSAFYPLIGIYYSANSPGIVTSSGTSLYFVWITNSNATPAAGWQASITCTTPTLPVFPMNTGTITACSGVFYDNGGPAANYPNNENRVQTFCSGSSDYLQFVFNNMAFTLGANDSLFVYDGPNTSSQGIAVFTSGSYCETITSTGSCVTFQFKSDGTGNTQGWQALFSCTNIQPAATSYNMSAGIRYTCNGLFYDDGGPTGQYNDYIDRTQVFISSSGCGLQANFTQFSAFGSSDILRIFDGPNATYPLIGTYFGINSPSIVTASSGAMTFEWNSNSNDSPETGWAATFSCPGQPAQPMASSNSPVCEGDTIMFFTSTIPGAVYNWAGPNSFTSTNQNPQILNSTTTNAGVYSVFASIGSCVSGQSLLSVNISPSPTVSASGSTAICNGNSATLTVEGANTYLWQPSFLNGSNITVSPTVTTTYIVTGTSINGCTNTDTVYVEVNPLPTVSLGADVTQCGGNVTLDAGNTGSTYAWSTSATEQSINISSSNTYSVVVTDGNNCSNSDTVVVTINPLPLLTTSLNAAVVTADQNGASYQWINCGNNSAIQGATSQSYTATANGSYAVIVTLNSCSDTSVCVIITTTGISSFIDSNQFSVYPNPNNGSFTIQSEIEGVYSIINELGQTIQSFKLNPANRYRAKMENLSNGVYFIIGSPDNQISKKIIVMTN